MDRRQRLLIAALLLMLIGYVADQAYRRLYEQPLQSARQRTVALEQELQKGRLDKRRQQNRLPELDQLRDRSLPGNLELAVTEYRSWLLRTIENSGMQQANLDSGSPARFRDLYTRIDFSLRTRGTLSQITEFLHAFYNARYLHKIRSLSLTPTADGIVDISLTIETLSIPSLARADQLPDPTTPGQAISPLEPFQVIARRNLFRPGEPPTASIKLSAITSDASQQRQAWLSFLRTGETRVLSEGDSVTLEGSSLKVGPIEPDTVTFEVDGQPREIRLGNTLEQQN